MILVKVYVNITNHCDRDIVSAKQIKVKTISFLAYLPIFSVIRNIQEGSTEF